jgi:hypothetical protein
MLIIRGSTEVYKLYMQKVLGLNQPFKLVVKTKEKVCQFNNIQSPSFNHLKAGAKPTPTAY